MINPDRPNTGVSDTLLSEKMIICCGEDTTELLWALRSVCARAETAYHEYRCYRFWKFEEFTLVWSGIGTGCIEPLLFELIDGFPLRQVVLIGTCGAIPGRGVRPGEVFLVDKAYLGGAAIRLPESAFPLSCRFGEERLAGLGLERKTAISTDFYYGFAVDPGARVKRLQGQDLSLAGDLAIYWDKADLVEMEIGQFYYLCSVFDSDQLEYVAIKGAANATDAIAEQTVYSRRVLQRSLASALQLLGVEERFEPPAAVSGGGGESAGDMTKLTEEIKLYWTIQLAVCAVLGYLGSNLDFSLAGGAKAMKNFVVSLIAFIPITIGSIYNLVGNYYIRMCGYTIEGAEQEDILSPALAIAYLIVSGMMWAVICHSFINYFWPGQVKNWMSLTLGLSVGILINLVCSRLVIYELCTREKHLPYAQRKYAGKYSEKLRHLYRCACPEKKR
ncbi:MAG: hypothetical protein GJT30_13995 [Geobacter sp.]|nr:hypothetical protein [Geobacter sp.]